MKKTICLVGGGTGGHIFPLYPLAKKLLKEGHEVHLVVNDSDLDRAVITDKFLQLEKLYVHYLKTHKIDYHFSFRNFVAPFKIISSFFRTKKLFKKINPEVVFFKGGFVGFPVVIALKYLSRYKGKIYLHDSDISAGKLTQFIGAQADKIYSNFGTQPQPLFYWPEKLGALPDKKKEILIFGGSQGAQFLNEIIIENLEKLTEHHQVILVAGPKNKISDFPKNPRLEVHQFMPQDQLIKKMLTAQIVICRSGASMFQVLAAKARCIAIPLPTSARNHQWENANYFEQKQLCYLLEQNQDTAQKLLPKISEILKDAALTENLEKHQFENQAAEIATEISQ